MKIKNNFKEFLGDNMAYIGVIISSCFNIAACLCKHNNLNILAVFFISIACISLGVGVILEIIHIVRETKKSNKEYNIWRAKNILYKYENNLPITQKDLKFIYKLLKRNKKDVLQKLKKENSKFKQK